MRERLAEYVPITQWLPRYERSFLSGDLLAALAVWAVLVPRLVAPGLLKADEAGLARIVALAPPAGSAKPAKPAVAKPVAKPETKPRKK